MSNRVYHHSFIDDAQGPPGGWLEVFRNGADGVRPHQRGGDGALVTRSPWWIDYNHAPPGGGYLHLLYCLHTTNSPSVSQAVREAGGRNDFIEGGYPVDFTNARLTVEMRGEVELQGAEIVLLIQAKTTDIHTGAAIHSPFLLTGQPFHLSPEYTTQTVTLTPDPEQWKCMGTRHDRYESYGWGKIEDVLADMNCDFMLVLHPLNVQPLEPFEGDFHLKKAGEEFEVDTSLLPSGYVELARVEIEFAS